MNNRIILISGRSHGAGFAQAISLALEDNSIAVIALGDTAEEAAQEFKELNRELLAKKSFKITPPPIFDEPFVVNAYGQHGQKRRYNRNKKYRR